MVDEKVKEVETEEMKLSLARDRYEWLHKWTQGDQETKIELWQIRAGIDECIMPNVLTEKWRERRYLTDLKRLALKFSPSLYSSISCRWTRTQTSPVIRDRRCKRRTKTSASHRVSSSRVIAYQEVTPESPSYTPNVLDRPQYNPSQSHIHSTCKSPRSNGTTRNERRRKIDASYSSHTHATT